VSLSPHRLKRNRTGHKKGDKRESMPKEVRREVYMMVVKYGACGWGGIKAMLGWITGEESEEERYSVRAFEDGGRAISEENDQKADLQRCKGSGTREGDEREKVETSERSGLKCECSRDLFESESDEA